jgi:uncharacterized damage-inducible protein DinB
MMSRVAHVRLMAEYNAWMNAKLLEGAARLPAGAVAADKGAFFGSVLGTLNHLVNADTIWLKRFAAHPARQAALDPLRTMAMPAGLAAQPFAELAPLAAHRRWLDGVIVAWAGALEEGELDHILHHANTKGEQFDRYYFSLIMHFFNHQTHHRGQVTTLLSQEGIDIGSTDLLTLIPSE